MFSRKELKDMITKSPQTKDGYFFFPRFRVLIELPGKISDSGYFYDRMLFKDKAVFDEYDLKLFMSKKKMNVDLEFNKLLNDKINDVIDGLEFLDLKDKVPNKDFSLEELIDTSIYITKYKYT
jgi:hypothetical protein